MPGIMGIRKVKKGDYMTKTGGGTDSTASMNYGYTPPAGAGGNIAGNVQIGGGSPTTNQSYQSPGYIPPKERKKKKYIQNIVSDGINDLNNIVQNKEILQNQAGLPAYSQPGHKFHDKMTDEKGNLIPYNQLNEAQKSIANFYGPSTANAYQQQLQNFITSSPINREIYKQSGLKGAGLNLFATEVPEKIIANTGIGKLISALGSAGRKITETLNPKDAKNLKTNIEENEQVIETLGKQDPNRFGSLGGDRFNTVEDIFDPEASAAMGSLDPEKIAMDTGLTPGTVYDPRQDNLKSKIDFVNQVFGTDFGGSVDMPNADTIEQLFQKAKQQQGGEIRDTIQNQQGEEESPVAGQFNFENFLSPYQDTITDINLTGQMEPVDPNSFPEEGVNKPATQAGQTLLFTDGTEVQEVILTQAS